MIDPRAVCAVDGQSVDAFLTCLGRTPGLGGLPTARDVAGTSLADLYVLPVTFTQRDGYLYYGEVRHAWEIAAQPLPSIAARARIVAREIGPS